MSVPSFGDLGQRARDIFRTGYHYGKNLIKFGARSTSSDLQVESDLRLDYDTSKLTGSAEAEYKTQSGDFMQKWTLDGNLIVGYRLFGALIPDTGLLSEICYNPETTAKNVKIGGKCTKQAFNGNCWISSDMNSNVNLLGSAVTAIKGLLIGYQAGYNTETNKMTKNDLAMCFDYEDMGIYLRCTSIPHEYGLSLLYKVTADWDTAINGILAINGGIQNWTLGAAAKCNIDDRSAFRCKFNTDLQLGMSLQQKIDQNVMLTLSFNVDCGNVLKGGHKVGLAVEIEA